MGASLRESSYLRDAGNSVISSVGLSTLLDMPRSQPRCIELGAPGETSTGADPCVSATMAPLALVLGLPSSRPVSCKRSR